MPPFKHPDFTWPTIRTITIKLRHMPDISIDASVSIDTGKPIVDFRIDDDDGLLTPAEARRISAALIKAANCCDAKAAAAKAWRSSPATEESSPRHTLKARRPS